MNHLNITMKLAHHYETEQSEAVSVGVGDRTTVIGDRAGDNVFVMVRRQLQEFERLRGERQNLAVFLCNSKKVGLFIRNILHHKGRSVCS